MKINYLNSGRMNLSDCIAIEAGICRKDSFKKITEVPGRHLSTIAREIKENRIFLHGRYPFGKDCRSVKIDNKAEKIA